MCVRCLAAKRLLDECSDSKTSTESMAVGGPAAGSSGTVVSDERSILYYLDGGDNFRWNSEDTLGSSILVTYSFGTGSDLPSVANAYDNPFDASSFSSFTEDQRNNFRLAASEFMAVSGIVLVEIESGADINVFNAHGTYVGGYADLPYVSGSYQSDVELVVDSSGDYDPGSYGYYTILHELGHAVGLDHTHEGAYTLSSGIDSTANTVMSYNYDGSQQGLKSLDHAALQDIYGGTVMSTGWSLSHNGSKSRLDGSGTGAADSFALPSMVDGSGMATKIMGYGGNDAITGNNAMDILRGNSGNDYLNGQGGSDKLRGGSGADSLFGGSGSDFIHGGSGDDTLYGGAGNDDLIGASGSDDLYGEMGNDLLSGLLGDDALSGGMGNDTLNGGKGDDQLSGGSGADVFVFGASDDADTIIDFNTTMDIIRFVGTGASFADLTLTAVSGGTEVALGGTVIELDGVSIGSLGADQFDFI